VNARTLVRAAAVVAAAALLVACGSDDANAPAATDASTTTVQVSVGGRACAMTSVEEVGKAIGVVPAAGVEDDRDGVLTCSFTDAAAADMATIVIVTADGHPSPTAAFAQAADAEGSQPIDGFGDQAVWAGDALHVSIGGEVVTFTIVPQATLDNSEAVRSATLEVATSAVARYAPPPVGS
jgi:hypothetical protein